MTIGKCKVRFNLLKMMFQMQGTPDSELPYPSILGQDVIGTIVKVGCLIVGQRVIGYVVNPCCTRSLFDQTK